MEQYGIIGWIVIGGIAGAIAKLLMPGKDPGGCIITILLGIAGALVAGWIGHAGCDLRRIPGGRCCLKVLKWRGHTPKRVQIFVFGACRVVAASSQQCNPGKQLCS